MANEDTKITLGVLNAIHENDSVTQRSVANELGVALGLVNSYLKRCVRKGYIKIQQAPRNRYAYYLTPQGLAEKSRLTAEYLTQGFKFFSLARREIEEAFDDCASHGNYRIVLYGFTELTEIAVLCAADSRVDIVAIIDPTVNRQSYAEIPVVGSLSAVPPYDIVVLTDHNDAHGSWEIIAASVPLAKIVTLPLLNIGRGLVN